MKEKKRSKFIYDVVSSFLNGKKAVVWLSPSWMENRIEEDWSYWAIRNLCAISDFKISDFKFGRDYVAIKSFTNF
jgi:hypothetical protein